MIPCVREMLIGLFGESKVHYDDKFTGGTYINVMTCISQGLAYAGYSNKEYIKDITSFDYGYMDAGTNSIDVVIPKGTRYDDALYIGDVSRQEYTREIEAVNPNESKFYIDIYEGNNQIMRLRFSKGGHSGQYKLFFSIEPKKGALRIDVYDSLYGGWVEDLSESDRMYFIPKN
jgi:hypothetical protein